jgi:hypothetical protein
MQQYRECQLNDFHVSSYFVSTKPEIIDQGTNTSIGHHTIRIVNLTDAPWDVAINSVALEGPDGARITFEMKTPPRFFEPRGTQEWTAEFQEILTTPFDATRRVLTSTTGMPRIRIQTITLRFKRPIWNQWRTEVVTPALEIVN